MVMISCELCGKELKQITHNHLIRHQITVAEYRQKFPDSPLQDPTIIKSGEDNPFFGKKHNPVSREIMSEKAKLRPIDPNIGKQISEKWKDPNGIYRKMMPSESYRTKMSETTKSWWRSADSESKSSRFEKMRSTNQKNKRWLAPEDKKPFVAYRDAVRKLSNENFVKHFYEIENAKLRGKGYDLDHIVSIYEGYLRQVPVEVMSSLANLRMILASINKKKSRKSEMSCEQLLREHQNEKND